MSTTQKFEYKGRTATITVAKTKNGYVGSFGIEGTDPPVTGVGADSNSEEGARTSAENKAKEMIDQAV